MQLAVLLEGESSICLRNCSNSLIWSFSCFIVTELALEGEFGEDCLLEDEGFGVVFLLSSDTTKNRKHKLSKLKLGNFLQNHWCLITSGNGQVRKSGGIQVTRIAAEMSFSCIGTSLVLITIYWVRSGRRFRARDMEVKTSHIRYVVVCTTFRIIQLEFIPTRGIGLA